MKSEKFGGDLVVAKDLKLGGLVKSNFSEELRVNGEKLGIFQKL